MLEEAKQFAKLGAEAVRSFSTGFKTSKKGEVNLVTEADLLAEKEIVTAIKKCFPSHSVLAEEGSGFGSLNDEYCWVVDPLDGTTNFAHGIPQVGVSVALCSFGKPIACAVEDVFRGDVYSASEGKGAYLNDERISVGSETSLVNSVIGTGFPYDRTENWSKYNRYFSNVCVKCRDLRRFGAASLDIAWVASGRFDGFFECGLKPWDLAAGMLLVAEAGGVVGSFEGEEGNLLEAKSFIAAGHGVYEELLLAVTGT